jgi:hypothetical protein
MEQNKKTLLFLIVTIGFLVRTYIWFNGTPQTYSLEALNQNSSSFNDGYLFIASTLNPSNDASFFTFWRSYYQMVYPLYLSPIFIFQLSPSIYIFWLHHLFAALTIIFIYFSALEIGNSRVGLLAALVYSCQTQIAFWFNWTYSDTAFHFQLSLFIYCSLLCWRNTSKKNLCCLIISGAIMSLTRPEGFLIMSVLLLCLLADRFGRTIVMGFILGAVLIILLPGTYFLSQNKVVQDKLFSNIHVASFLYLGSLSAPTSVKGYGELQSEMSSYARSKSGKQLNDTNSGDYWYGISVAGWERIKRDPSKYIFILLERIPQVIYPSFYREGVSWRYKLIDRSIMFFITIGVTCALLYSSREKPKMMGLFLMASSIYLILVFYHSEWDLRVHLSTYVILIPLASVGWVASSDIYSKGLQLLKLRK